MTTIPSPTVPVTNDAELRDHWCALLDLGGLPVGRTLFLSWVRPDGTRSPMMIPFEDAGEPTDDVLTHLLDLHGMVAEAERVEPADLHLAMCLERRGPAGLSPADHGWCSAVEELTREGLDCSLHVGNGRIAVPVLPRRRWPSR